MRLKSPIRLNRRGHPRSRLTTLVTVGTVTLGFVGFAVAQAGLASADPHQIYTTVGSDTIQDVMNQFSLDLGVNTLGSWNAVDPVSNTPTSPPPLITPNNAAGGQCSFSRPNGSGQGLAALRKSINQNTTATQLPVAPGANCIDFSRSSSGPGTNASPTGALVYIPFALDAVSIAAGPTTTIAQANNFTLANLQSLYASCASVTVGGVTYNPGTGGNIDLYIPQSGSGTLNFWASVMGFSTTTLPACLHQTIVGTTTLVEEHDGTAVATDPNGIMPFSIAQWISQRNGHNDRRHGAVLENIGGTFPCAGSSNCSAAGTTLNTAFPITREVYDVVPFNKVTSGMTGFDPALAQLLASANSNLCQDIFTIQGFGFALLGSTTTDLCGSTASSLRAFDPTTNPV